MTCKVTQNKRRALGLCPLCGSPADGIKIKCVRCAESDNKSTKALQLRYKEQGLCIACGKREVDAGLKCRECQDKYNQGQRLKYKYVRDEVISVYGGYKCVCCGETHPEFLTIDHMNGGGRRHRLQTGYGRLFIWLKKNNYPEGYQVLCFNCNYAKYKYGVCPHIKEGTNALQS